MPGRNYRCSMYLAPVLLLLLVPGAGKAQNGPVTGRVLSQENNRPLPGVTIQVKGKPVGGITTPEGTFSIPATLSDTLVVSYIGYTPLLYPVKQRTDLRIFLSPDNKTLSDVVVVGYGTQRKRDVTGAVSSVKSKDIASLPVPNVGEALQGRAAGVQIVSSGAPGSNVTIRVRGVGTINNADPLLVIDGVPSDIPLNALSPDDIASVEVLKDASAAAIYGSRGANGVLMITTKKGTAGANHLEAKYYTGVQSAANVVKMLNASQFASLHNEMMANNGQPQNPDFADPPALGVGTNWLDALFRQAPMQNVSLAYSGGNDKTNYYVSGGVFDQKGIVINTDYRRYNFQLNLDTKVFDWLKFGNNLSLSADVKNNGGYNILSTMAALPTQPVYNEDGSWSGPEGRPSWSGDVRNPIGTATINTNTTKGYNVLGNIYGEVTLLKDLKFRSTGGMQYMSWDSRSWNPQYDWKPIPVPNSSLSRSFNKSITLLWDNYLTYDRFFGKDHHLTVMAGSSAQNNTFEYLNGGVQGFADDRTNQVDNGLTLPTVGGNASDWAILSFIGRANYAYKDKYLLTATIRRDGSSRFGPSNKYGTFPSASVAWRISNEDFFKNITLINDLKLRAGYGVTGNQNIGNYGFASVYQTVQYNFNGTPVTAVVPQSIPNPAVHWEEVAQSNIGVDVTLLNNRITVTADAYLKNTNGMLVPMSVPISTGYSDIVVPSINAGKMQNKGIEIAVITQNIRGAFEWSTSFNVSFNKNKIISLNDSVPMFTGSIGLNQNLAIHSEGHPLNSFYGFVTNGIFQNQKEVDGYAVQVPGSDPYNRTSPGDIKFRDLNNDGIIDDADRTFLGNPNPTVIFAMNNSFAYKGIDLGIFLQGVSGNRIFNANRINQEGMAVAQNQTTAVLDRWRGEGTSNTMPRAVFNDPNKNTRVSDRYIEDGAYLRIKNVTLGYTLPKLFTEKAKISTARIYISCQNLVTFTKYTGFDPEVAANGIDLNVYPVTRTLSAGINLAF